MTVRRAVIYARRSQQHQDASVATQVEEAKRFIAKMGWTLVNVYPDDEQHTGRKEFKKRKQFLKLLADANEGTFDVVVVRDHTRLGGDTSRTMRAVEDLKDEGVTVWYYISTTEVRLDTWIDKATFAFQSAASEGERDGISSRTYEALMVRARNGYNAGGSCFGYDNVPILEGSKKVRTEYAINEREAEIVREIFRMYATGDGLRTIAKALNERGIAAPQAGKRGTGSWSLSVIQPMLSRQRYVGMLVYGRMKKGYRKGTKVRELRPEAQITRVEKPELRIVPEELWNSVQGRIRRNVRQPWNRPAKGGQPKHMLSKLARCAQCGGPIHAKSGKTGKVKTMMYVCGYFHDRAACKNSLRRPVAAVDAMCLSWIKENVLREEVVLAILDEVRRRVVEQSKDSGSEVGEIEEQIASLRREITRLAKAIAITEGAVEALTTELVERQSRLGALEGRLKLLRASPEVFSLELDRLEERARERIEQLRSFLERDTGEARKVIESLLDEPMKFTPIETPNGRRYEVTGRIATGQLLRVLSDPSSERPHVDEFRTALLEMARAA